MLSKTAGASKRLVVVGGVAGGATAAAKARRVNETAEITVFERGPHISFANCGLPYYVGGIISEQSKLLLSSPERFYERYRVKVHVNHTVKRIDRSNKSVLVYENESRSEQWFPYDSLILATGAGTVQLSFLKCHDAKNVFCLKTVPDSDDLKSYANKIADRNGRVIVLGAGFVGMEIAEVLHGMGLKVTVVEAQSHILPNLDIDMGSFMQANTSNFVTVETGRKVVDVNRNEADKTVDSVKLDDGRVLPCDLLVLCIGVRPEIQLAEDAGLEIGKTGGVVTNDKMETSDPSIYCVGDSAEILNLVTGQPDRFPLAGPANKQGRVAGANSVGGNMTYTGSLGTAIVQSFGLTAASTGLSEQKCKQLGIDYSVSIVHPYNHVSYMPDAHHVHIKLLSERKSGRILGAQAIGQKDVDKRIDVVATAIVGKMSVLDLEGIDLCYSPQFGAANDPITISGFVAADNLRGEDSFITAQQLLDMKQSPLQIVDVREPYEYEDRHIVGAVNIPLHTIRDHYAQLKTDTPVVVYCAQGLRAHVASRMLRQLTEFTAVHNLTGGVEYMLPPLSDQLLERGSDNTK